MRAALYGFLFLIAVFSGAGASAAERIDNFVSEVRIGTDGALSVTESISVTAENDRIQRGIFRDFPTIYRDRAGNRIRVRFDVESVERNGRPEPYVIEPIENGVRVRIGSGDVTIPRGNHRYVIVYKTDRQIGFFPNYDELYWNATGNGWVFPIMRAEAIIRLPPGAMLVQTASYTGPQGATGTNARASIENGLIRFVTSAPLDSYEGLTIAAGFSKGAVTPPTEAERAQQFLRDNAATGAALAGLIALFVFYYMAWSKYGRDPQRGTVIPLFAPPKKISAAAMRFVRNMAYDRKCFSAALIAMAVKGYLRIDESAGTYTLARTGKSEAETGLQSGEKAIARELFGGHRDSIELKNANHKTVSRAISALRGVLKREDEGVHFVTNRGWFLAGVGIMGLSGATATLLSDDPAPAGFILLWLAGWTAGTSALLYQVYTAWMGAISGPGSRIFNIIGTAFTTAFSVPFVGGLVMGVFFLGTLVDPLTLVAMVAQGILAVVFYRLLKAPTLAGAKIHDEIDGFKMYLTVAEQKRLEVLHPPEVTPEVFEKFLPYAIALDAENAWSKKFEAETAKAAADPTPNKQYSPSWYSGTSFNRLGTGAFTAGIGTAVASATAAAATAPGRSSGSGGGGSSGGGGGGGGGGGW